MSHEKVGHSGLTKILALPKGGKEANPSHDFWVLLSTLKFTAQKKYIQSTNTVAQKKGGTTQILTVTGFGASLGCPPHPPIE